MFKRKKSDLTLADFADVHVTLKPFLGIPPRLYLKVIYAIILLLILFFLCLYPGLTQYGSQVTLTSAPHRASVYINDKRVGSTPMTLFVPAGEYTIRYKKPHFSDHEEVVTVKGRRLFSRFFPKKVTLNPQLNLIDLPALLETSYKEASFAYSASYNPTFPREPFLLHALDDILHSDIDLNQSNILRWAADSWFIVSDQASLEEVITLWSTLADKGLAVDPNLMTGIQFDTKSPKLEDIIAFQKERSQEPIERNDSPRNDLSILNLTFTYAPATHLLMGNPASDNPKEFASYVNLSGFYYTEELITQQDFNRILANIPNPDDQAEIGFNRFDATFAEEPVSYVSVAGARRFIELINRELSRRNLPWRARLPYESEWEYLIQNQAIETQYYEWMEEPYYPLKNLFFATRPTAQSVFIPFLQSVRGFEPDHPRMIPSHSYTRGAQNPYWQSPYVSFRVVLEEN
ncbi:PEGA domain-containing protein [Entomospira culicis]|uniref:PEGA domain-containing protein n=1 Tax=Entomospira culicis TaxID=2719989 RepID=A0A968GG82_9SPIO|nr:PEGA domain-containing protein [Entomospira culicis]NIZ19363.1 PEGA domain-containing protein [Entomospira culicis]NIZ69732.1 PEGA domain-containing protein [Entomospira culicis]WDI36843.1 PEGA domain-containing protein [Entomospira culicis]WDI38472.1 PEGA domain-containing protein [Entomospira culicis]